MTYKELVEHCGSIDTDCDNCIYEHGLCRAFYIVQGRYPFYFKLDNLDEEIDEEVAE